MATLCHAIWQLERELDLLSWRIQGAHPWPIIRMRVFHELTKRGGIHGEPHPVRRTRSDKARLVGKHVAGVVGKNPFLASGAYDALVVPHPRKPAGIEIYTDKLRAELGASALVLDSGINGTPLAGSRNLDFFTSAAGAVRSRSIDARTTTIANALEALTGVKVPIGALVAREIPKHLRLRTLYRALLRRHRIKTVYSVVSYFHQHITGAARDLGVPVIELQHGAISPYHLGYSYPGSPVVADQPDELWCFGSYWETVAELPAGMSTAVIGAPFLPAADASLKVDDQVLFLSQGTIGRELFDFAVTFAGSRPELDVVYRLHPSEHLGDYLLPVDSRLRVSAGSAESTVELQRTAAYQVGVSTTALFEGMALGCKTAVAELPGHEYLQPVVDRGDALLVPDAGTLAARLDEAPVCADSSVYYAADRLSAVLKDPSR
ncbi:hypothetical protein GCM10009741_40510 [Kribbella lupini]|uniref:Capsular polysaccharide biosynthesis protein n=2 Tax=Kribbella lupini TaxID=291602 RepID=A0ABN2B536_9ACTN